MADGIAHHGELIDRLAAALPLELDRLGLSEAMGLGKTIRPLHFRFAYLGLPFAADVQEEGSCAVLHLHGECGLLPFTAEAGSKRRALLRVLDATTHDTGLEWQFSPHHEIRIVSRIELARPLGPASILAGAIAPLIRAHSYLLLLLEIIGGVPVPETAS